MNLVKSTGLFLTFIFLSGCFPAGNGGYNNNPNNNNLNNQPRNTGPSRSDSAYERRKEVDEDRSEVIEESRRRRRGSKCEDEDRDHDCKDQCRDIYTRRSDREDCEELTVDQIANLEELDKILKDPDEDELSDIDHEDFDVYLNVSIAPFDKHVGRYSTREAKEFIFWAITDEEIARIIKKEEDDYEILDNLLKQLASFSGDDHYKPFIARVDGSDKLMEVAIADGSEVVLEWFQDYINEKNGACSADNRGETHEECFKVYCEIGKAIDDDLRDDWLSYEDFEDYIDDVIEDGTNCDNWDSINRPGLTSPDGATCAEGNSPYEDSNDIEDWYDDLCRSI